MQCLLSWTSFLRVRDTTFYTILMLTGLAEEGDDSDDDDDVQVGGVTQDYRCPITLTILVDPLTS